MHAITFNRTEAGQHLQLVSEMFRLRRRIFKDRLDWTVSVSDDLEIDIYDALDPTYVLILSDQAEVLGSVRLLATTGPNMLAETFPQLLGGAAAPSSPDILESSRFCVDTQREVRTGGSGLHRATFALFAAMLEAMRLAHARAIVTVTDTRMERILRRAGWPLQRLGEPKALGQTMALAGFLHASDEVLAEMYGHAGIEGPVLKLPSAGLKAA